MDKGKKIIIALLVVVLILVVFFIIKYSLDSNVSGSIFVDSFPKECEVVVNGEMKGKTPIQITGLSAGEYIVQIKKDGYKEAVKTVEIDKNHSQRSIYVALEHETFSLNVTSYPSEAEVYVDGIKKGITPLIVEDLVLGKHFLEIKKEKFETWKKEIEAINANVVQVDALLVPSTTKIVIASNPDKAKVLINGEEKGQTPFTSTEFEPGTYEITVYIPGYIPYKEKISIEKGQTLEREVVLTKASTFLSIITNPSGANVYINNVLKGITPYEEANIQAGTYTVRLEKEGYLPYTTDITIIKDKKEEININLLKLP